MMPLDPHLLEQLRGYVYDKPDHIPSLSQQYEFNAYLKSTVISVTSLLIIVNPSKEV